MESVVAPHVEPSCARVDHLAAVKSPLMHSKVEAETETSLVAEPLKLQQPHEDGGESDKARTDSDDDDDESSLKPLQDEVLSGTEETVTVPGNEVLTEGDHVTTSREGVEAGTSRSFDAVEDPLQPIGSTEVSKVAETAPTTPKDATTGTFDDPTSFFDAYEELHAPTTPIDETFREAHDEPFVQTEAYAEPTTPVDVPPENSFEEKVAVEKELVGFEPLIAIETLSSSESTGVIAHELDAAKQAHEVEWTLEDEEMRNHEVELVLLSPKRPSPLPLVEHDVQYETSDHDDQDDDTNSNEADLGTPLGFGGQADFDQDEFTSHRFLGPSIVTDPSSTRALHTLRRVSLHDQPPRFVSDAPLVAPSSGSLTSSGESSGRNSSIASGVHTLDAKSELRSQSVADYVEHPLNTYTLTFTEQVLGFTTNVVVSLENELLVEVQSVEKESSAYRGGVVVGDCLVSVNGLHFESHLTEDQVVDMIQTSTLPRTCVFQRDLHDKDTAQFSSLPDKKLSPTKPLMGRLGAAMSQGALMIGSRWKRKKTVVHANSFCDGCGMDPVVGALWTCSVCSNYNLCSECYDLGTHGMENTEQMQALTEAIVQFKLQKRCKYFTPEFLLSLRRDICKGRPDKFEYLGEWIANIVVGTSVAKITVRGIEIPTLLPMARQRFVSYLMPLVSNRTDIEVHIEWLPDDSELHYAAVDRASVDRMSVGVYTSADEEEAEEPMENFEKLRIWISDKKTRTTSPFA